MMNILRAPQSGSWAGKGSRGGERGPGGKEGRKEVDPDGRNEGLLPGSQSFKAIDTLHLDPLLCLYVA
ncbi:unnamed protein product [Coccothraustes coccothraustes]